MFKELFDGMRINGKKHDRAKLYNKICWACVIASVLMLVLIVYNSKNPI